MYERILVATDGSEAAEAPIDEAVRLAALSGATLSALYVVDTREYNTLPETKWLTLDDELEAQGQRAVDVVRERGEAAAVTVETAVVRGIPHREIVEYAEGHDVDLVVVGTHGRSGLDHLLIGSVAEKVVRSARVPVHVVPIRDVTASE